MLKFEVCSKSFKVRGWRLIKEGRCCRLKMLFSIQGWSQCEVEVWGWSLKLTFKVEYWSWGLKFDFEAEVWFWSLKLEFADAVWSLRLKYEVQVSSWSLKLKIEVEDYR